MPNSILRKSGSLSPLGRLAKRGFTLIEILVVISLIAVLALGVGMIQPSVDSALSGSVRSVGGLIKLTRAEAAQRSVKSRMLICKNSPDVDKQLRFATIAVWQPGVEDGVGTEAGGWVPTTSNFSLPTGIYFYEKLLTGAGGSGRPMEMTFDPENNQPQTSGKETYYYFEFTSDGITENGAGAKVVLVPGTPSGQDGALEFVETKFGGLVIHQTGATSYARDPNDLLP